MIDTTTLRPKEQQPAPSNPYGLPYDVNQFRTGPTGGPQMQALPMTAAGAPSPTGQAPVAPPGQQMPPGIAGQMQQPTTGVPSPQQGGFMTAGQQPGTTPQMGASYTPVQQEQWAQQMGVPSVAERQQIMQQYQQTGRLPEGMQMGQMSPMQPGQQLGVGPGAPQGGGIGAPMGGGPMGEQPGGGQPMPGQNQFPYPEAWGQAGDIYGQLAGGMPGMPDPSAIWGGYQQQAGDLARQLAEQAGLGYGSRYGSALGRNIADVGMRAGERFGGEMERLRMGDLAGQRSAMLGAAQGLGGLGQQQAYLPGNLAQQQLGMGQTLQQMQQAQINPIYQEYLRTHPSYSQLLPAMSQGANIGMGPQMYQPGWASGMMDLGGQLGMMNMLGGFGG